jgi:hypothetical protein
MRVIMYLAGLVAVGAYGFLAWTIFTGLVPEAGGLWPLDLRATGYGPVEVEAYLAALTDRGRELILGPMRMADTVFPIALALWLAAGAVRQGAGRLAWVAVLLALAYLGADLAENAAVRRMVSGPVEVDPLTVSGASVMTVTKYLTLASSIFVLGLSALFGRR